MLLRPGKLLVPLAVLFCVSSFTLPVWSRVFGEQNRNGSKSQAYQSIQKIETSQYQDGPKDAITDSKHTTGDRYKPGEKRSKRKRRESETCHGPLYYKLKARDKTAREREAARKKMLDWVGSTGATLLKQWKKYARSLMNKDFHRYLKCITNQKRPTVLCLAMAHKNVDLCEFYIAEKRKNCRLLTNLGKALGLPRSEWHKYLDADIVKLAKFVISSRYQCESIERDKVKNVCKQLRTNTSFDLSQEDDSPAKEAWVYLNAFTKKDRAYCEYLKDAKLKEACRAAISGSAEHCSRVRPLYEPLDLDYSCRNPLLKYWTYPLSSKVEVVALLGFDYPGSALCFVNITIAGRIRGRQQDTTVRIGPVELPVNGWWTTIRYTSPDGFDKVMEVTAQCQWDAETSKYPIPGQEPGEW